MFSRTRAILRGVFRGRNGRESPFSVRLLAAALLVGPASAAPNETGVNLDVMTDWSPAWSFVDGFQHARTWLPQPTTGTFPWNTGQRLDVDGNANIKSLQPGQAAAALMFWDLEGHYPGGDYICRYDGVGELDFHGSASLRSAAPGRAVVSVKPEAGGVVLRIVRTDPANPVRNIRFFMPGFESGSATFHPKFLELLRPFRVIRFMDWQRMNRDQSGRWADRTTLESASQTGPAGVSLERMIELANTTGADPWFCMPHRADDDFVRKFAQMTRERLDPKRRVYVEYSNEVWNGIFPQANYAREEGLRLGLSGNAFQAQLRYYSQRSVEIFKIWQEVFAGSDRLVRVLSSQSVNPWTARTILEWNDAGKKADALAIAPYFGGNLGSSAATAGMTVDQILDVCESDIQSSGSIISANAAAAREFNVDLISYEGGQHLAAVGANQQNETMTRLFKEANEHPRMKELYRLDAAQWRKSGGGLMVTYCLTSKYGKHGCFGLVRWQDQDLKTAPKYEAFR